MTWGWVIYGWTRAEKYNLTWFKGKVKQYLQDQFLQTWYMHVDTDDVFSNYRMFKPTFGSDPFFTSLPDNCVICLARFRTTNNVLPVHRLRFDRIPRRERTCEKCTLQDVGDEFHYIFVCPFFDALRKQNLPRYFFDKPNVLKYHKLMSTKKRGLLLKLKHFVCRLRMELM